MKDLHARAAQLKREIRNHSQSIAGIQSILRFKQGQLAITNTLIADQRAIRARRPKLTRNSQL